MKRFLLLIFCATLTFTGCDTFFDDSGSGFGEAIFSVSDNNVHFGCDGGDYAINVRSSSHWRATCDASWINLQNTVGYQGVTPLRITVTANSTTASRTGTIKVENSTYNLTKIIKISQDAFSPQLSPSESTISFSTDEETRTITINSNIYWEATCDANWINLWNTVGSKGSSNLKFTVKANTITQTRTATIKVTNTDYNLTKEIKITQSDFVPELTFSEDEIETSIAEETRTIIVNSNAIWRATCDANWINLWNTIGSNGASNLKFTVRANNIATRVAAIKVTLEDYNITKEIQITQFVPKLELSKTEISASAAEETHSLTIDTNMSWTATCEADWITLSPTSGPEGVHTLNIAIKANTLTMDRAAIIKINNSKYNITKEIKVSQVKFVPEINLSTSSISADVSEETKSIDITSNISWKATSDADWITLSPTSGVKGTSSIKLSIKANALTSKRSATIKIFNEDYNLTKEVKVTQAEFVPTMTFSPSPVAATAEKSSKIVTVVSNIAWTATCTANWASLKTTSGPKGTSTLEIDIEANPNITKRYTAIKFSSDQYNISFTLDVKQEQYNAIFYTSHNGKTITPNNKNLFGANIVSNTYTNGKGVILFDGPINKLPNGAFNSHSNLKSISIPDSVTALGDAAFHRCEGLESITIPNGVKSIGVWTFNMCGCRTITLPESVTSIGEKAFHDSSLDVLYCKPTTPPAGSSEMFYKNFVIYVPRASVSAYKSAPYWSGYAGAIVGYDF